MLLLSGVSSEASGLGMATVHFLSWLFPVPLPIPLGCDPVDLSLGGSLRLTSSDICKAGLFSPKPWVSFIWFCFVGRDPGNPGLDTALYFMVT